MKKILFLLLCTVSMYGQISTGQEQEFDTGIKNNSTQTVTEPIFVTTQGTDGTYGKITLSNLQNKKSFLSTGLLKNAAITINGDPTKFNITAGIGIISNFDDPSNPISTIINFPAFTGVTPTYLTTGNITYVAINSTPAIVMQATPFTAIQRRDLIELGAVIHSNLTTINVINNISSPTEAGTNQLHDLFDFIGALNLSGNVYSANGANLQLNKSAGIIGKRGINFINNWKDPHRLSQVGETALSFRYRTQNGTEGSDRINLDPALYDLNNVLTVVPNNKFTIQTVVMFQTGLTRILYGQNVYDDLNSARNAIFTRSFVIEPNSKENGIIRAYIIMKNTTTSLQNVADAKILEAQKFGGVASGGVALTLANIVTALGYTPENEANKQNSLATDGSGIKYPTVDAVNTGTTYKRTIAQIRALTGTLPNTNFYTTDLGQEGDWYYDSTDAVSTDNTGTILVTSDGKRIKRIFDNGVDIKWFGAKITNTATQNNTAIDLAIAWAISNNGGKIRIPKGTYLVNPIHIPYVGISAGRIVPIEIVGEFIPNQLFGTIGSLPLASSGSVLSCASTTAGQSVIIIDPHPTDFGNFSAVKPIIKNLDIRTYQNSQIGGIDARYAQQLVIENCQITNGVYSVDSVLPTYPNAIGLYTPNVDNAALNILKNISISGFYTGLVVNEHTDGQSLNLTCNLNAMEFKQANHSSNFGMIDMQRNTIGMKFTGIHAVNIDNLNLEHAGDSQTTPANIWQKTTYDIDDASNNAKGLINWHSVLGATGTTPDDFRKNGGEKVKYINLYRAKTETASSTFGGEYKYNSDINTANSRAWRSKTDYPITGSWSLQVANDLPESLWTDVINATKEGRVDFNKSFSVSENVTASLSVTSFYLKNNNGTNFGESASFFQTNNFAYLNIAANQTNIYAYRSGGLRLATGNSRIVFANGNVDLDASTEKMAIETTGVVKIANLSGTGTRTVVADASGNLSTTGIGYKVYTALLNQTGTSAPTATILDNTFGGTIVWTRNNTGNYYATLTGVFTTAKTIMFTGGNMAFASPFYTIRMDRLSSDVVQIFTQNSTGDFIDSVLANTSIEIRVYNFMLLFFPYSMLKRRKRKIKQLN